MGAGERERERTAADGAASGRTRMGWGTGRGNASELGGGDVGRRIVPAKCLGERGKGEAGGIGNRDGIKGHEGDEGLHGNGVAGVVAIFNQSLEDGNSQDS